MKKFKKIISFILCFTMLLASLTKQIKAIDIIDNTVLVINNEIVEELLVDSGYSGNNFETYILYNNESIPTYTLGLSENGYIIVENATLAIHEYGEGNPYENANGSLYYAGPLNYYTKENNIMTDLTTMGSVSEMATSLSILPEINNGNVSVQSTTENGLTRVSNYKDYIQKRAFAKNTNNVCGAVAVQIALNYLELQTRRDFVHSTHESELLSINSSYSSSRYPKAAAMLSYLVNVCGIGPSETYIGLRNGFSEYVDITNITDKNISITYTSTKNVTTMKNSINNNKPLILLTNSSTPTYGNHYVVAYGYKVIEGGNFWMVHTGWYENGYVFNDNGVIRQADKFIANEYVNYVFYFSY